VVAVRLGKTLVVALAAAVVACVALAGLATAAPNPPGNNGTVKIDREPFDDHPNNEPHVGCTFQVDFYGYDQGDLDAVVTFESHPPTGPVRVLLTDTVFIGEDDNSGGGSQAGLDASETYTLDFTGIEPHPNQGFHVKLTVNAEGSQGADVKHKVFWVTGCPPGPGGTTTTTKGGGTTSSTTSTTGATSTSGATSTTGGATSSTGGATSTSGQGSSTSAVGGASSTVPSTTEGEFLPFTGANILSLLLAGLVLLSLGTVTLLARSRQGRA
jgi:hypothetical protein